MSSGEQYRELGFCIIGPIVARFLIWLAQEVAGNEDKPIFFLSREGFLLLRFYEQFRSLPGVQQEFGVLPQGHYLLSSRTALIGAAPKTEASELQQQLGSHNFEGTIEQLFSVRFGCSEATLKLMRSSATAQLVNLPRDLERVTEVALSHRDVLERDAEKCRVAYKSYLRTVGFLSEQPVGIVDLGYSASQQGYLFSMTGQPMSGYYFLTTECAATSDRTDSRIYSCFGAGIDPHHGPPMYRYSLFLEAILTAPQGQLIRFELQGNDMVHPVFRRDLLVGTEWQYIQETAQGVASYIDLLVAVNSESLLEVLFDDQALHHSLVDLARGTVPFDTSELHLTVEDLFCGNDQLDVFAHYCPAKS